MEAKPAARRLYCMDLGTGTLDVLLRDPEKLPENQTRFVAPSPALTHMKQVEFHAGAKTLWVDGWIVGGGPFAKALKERAKDKRTVLSTRCSAIVKNDPGVVKAAGIEISDECPDGAAVLHADELRLDDHRKILAMLGEDPPEGYAIAVQDHGGSDDGLPDRVHRFSEFRRQLQGSPRLEDFAFCRGEVPATFRRLSTSAHYLEAHGDGQPWIVMDTVFAGLLGCLAARDPGTGTCLLVNIGNSHVTAALVRQGHVLGLFEHHTRVLKKDPDGLLIDRLAGFCRGVLTEDGVRADGGCGVWYRAAGTTHGVDEVRCSGPRRSLLAGRRFPWGTVAEAAFQDVDAMMVGPLGLARAFDYRHGGPG